MSYKYKYIFNKIVDENNVYDVYKKTQRGSAKYKYPSLKFSQNLCYNLEELRQSVNSGDYCPDGYYIFKVYDPKERLIYAPRLKDKIVQHMVNNVLKNIYQPCFIYDSYACLEGKGTHRAVNRLQQFLKNAKYHYGKDSYILKLDIKKFFYTIDRDILKNLLLKKIQCKETLNLLYKIIDSSPEHKGIPLGNLTSQLFANIYLNEMDNYIKRELGVKYYVRYADDATAVLENKTQANEVRLKTERLVNDYLNLELHPEKTKVFPIKQGVNTMGFKTHSTHKKLRDQSKRKIKRKLNKMKRLIDEGYMSKEKAEQIINSWKGHAEFGDSFNFINKLLNKHDFIYKNDNNNFIVNV